MAIATGWLLRSRGHAETFFIEAPNGVIRWYATLGAARAWNWNHVVRYAPGPSGSDGVEGRWEWMPNPQVW
jgi:hypothetical protein